MIMSNEALALAMAGLVPLLIYVMWSDAKAMRIPNICCLLAFLIFIPTGLWGLPLETFLWRIGHAVIAYGLAYGLWVIAKAKVGGGDLKLIIAMTPYVPGAYLGVLLMLWAGLTLGMLGIFFALRWSLAGRDYGFAALGQQRYFPAGLSISGAFLVMMVLQLTGKI